MLRILTCPQHGHWYISEQTHFQLNRHGGGAGDDVGVDDGVVTAYACLKCCCSSCSCCCWKCTGQCWKVLEGAGRCWAKHWKSILVVAVAMVAMVAMAMWRWRGLA
eukprot:4997107-Alexandrium_andersonii.AAC.1